MADPRVLVGDPAMETFLLGQVDFDACLALQQRLVFESGGRADGQVSLLLCEHANTISVGRLGSRADIRVSPEELARRRWDVRWVNRGGGSVLHLPGQLAVYPIVPLDWHGFTVGDYLSRLQNGILATLADLGIAGQTRPGNQGIWGRTGQLATFGVAVKSWTTYFGATINVDPALRAFRGVNADPLGHSPTSSLAAEQRRPVKMTTVRATIIRHLATAFGCERYHLYTGHPLLTQLSRPPHEPVGTRR